jgi:hypothetical protein
MIRLARQVAAVARHIRVALATDEERRRENRTKYLMAALSAGLAQISL